MSDIQQSKRCRLQPLSLVITLLLLTSTTQAEGLDNNHFFSNVPEVVSDSEMSEMRGRFIQQGRPVYFGISMQSQWSTATGEIVSAGMNIGINLNKSFASGDMVSIEVLMDEAGETPAPTATGGEPLTVGEIPSTNIDMGGLDSAKGVTQAISVAGDDNQAHNKTYMTMQFTSPEQANSATPGSKVYYFGGQNLSTSQTSSQINTNPTSQVSGDGAISTAFVDETGVGIKIEVPEQGSAMQLLKGSGNANNGSGIFQSIQINGGDGNNVTNQLNFAAEFAPFSGNANLSIQPALDSLKAIQGIGIQ